MPRQDRPGFRGGVRRPRVNTGPASHRRTMAGRQAMRRQALAAGGIGRQRDAGMLLDFMPPDEPSLPWGSNFSDAYRNSYADGARWNSGTQDIPTYFAMMNLQNGGIIYWPQTLREKYEWYRYWTRCIYLGPNDVGLVTMADGTVRDIRDVQVGDEIVTGLGTVRRVKDKFERRAADDRATTIKAWCLQNHLKTTHHHPYWVLRGDKLRYANGGRFKRDIRFEPEWVHAENVRPGDYVLFPPLSSKRAGDITPEQARVLGYYAAEGSLVKAKRCIGTGLNGKGYQKGQEKRTVPVGVSFALSVDERESVAESVIAAVSAAFGKKARIARERGNGLEVVVNGREIADFCLKHCGEYSDRKRLSPEVVYASNEARLAFLLAYAEGDHQYGDDHNRGKVVIVTASHSLASQVQMLAISCGVMCRYASYERVAGSGYDSGTRQIHVSIPPESANRLVQDSVRWDESPTRGDAHGAFFINGYAAFKVREVSFSQEDDTVYNLEVDAEGDEKSYICNGMVTHNTDAYIGRGMELLADLPMSKITLHMPKMEGKKRLRAEIEEFYRYMVQRLGLFDKLRYYLWEYNMIGNCFLFHEWDEDLQMWSRLVFLPPEEVRVFYYPHSEDAWIEYRPEKLIQLVRATEFSGTVGLDDITAGILENLPADLVEMIRQQGCIRMDSDPMSGSFVHHAARRKSPYQDLGASVLERVLVPMLMKEHYKYTQLNLASRNMTPKNLITAPGLTPPELDNLREQIDLSYMDPDYSVVTNYDVSWEELGADGRLLDLDSEYERIESQVFAAMGVTRDLLTGEGSWGGNKFTVEILNTMFLLYRTMLQDYVEQCLFLPVAEAHGWYEEGKNGIRHYFYPKLGFNRLTIRDNEEVFDSLWQLYQKGSLPVEVIYELFNLDTESLHERIYDDLFTVRDPTFNRLVENVNDEAGNVIAEKTDAVDKIIEYLGLERQQQSDEEDGGW